MRLQLGLHAYNVTHRPVVAGILNRTRDSFYDRGRLFDLEALLRAAEQMAGEGADVLEVGCRPGGVGVQPVSPAEETDLAGETLEKLRARFDLPLAVDTWRAGVAAAAFSAGAVLGNDMSGFRDPEYLPAAARAGAWVVATHIRLEPGIPDTDPHYRDVVADVEHRLREHLRAAGPQGSRRTA